MIQCNTCGARFPDGTPKCKFCGSTELSAETPKKSATPPGSIKQPVAFCSDSHDFLFSRDDWSSQLSELRYSASCLVLILTNTAGLSDCQAFRDAIRRYSDARAAEDVKYCVLDLRDQRVASCATSDCASIVAMLRTVYSVAVPDFLLIMGDHNAVPSMIWANEGDQYDANILSDLAYTTLDADSPWSGVSYDFGSAVPASRIPSAAEHNFSEAIAYMNFVAGRTRAASCKAFALTTASWEATSRNAFAPVSAHVEVSPPNTIDRYDLDRPGYHAFAGIDNSYNLLCFNLHGGPGFNLWLGESASDFFMDDSETTIAFHPSYFPQNSEKGYVVCTEACYGADPLFDDSREASALNYALSNRCIAFVGSTRVAWGCGNGSFYAADVIANAFPQMVAMGLSIGDSYILALDSLYSASNIGPDEKEIKTLAEFGLYGDPSLSLAGFSFKQKGAISAGKPRRLGVAGKKPANAVSLMSCNTAGGAVSNFASTGDAQILMKAKRIAASCKSHVAKNFSTVGAEEPQVFKVVGRPGFRAFVNHKSEGITKSVCCNYDDDCNLKSVCFTK